MLDLLNYIWTSIGSTFLTLIIFIGVFYLVKLFLDRQVAGKPDWSLIRSIILFLLGLTGIIAVILALPMSNELRGQITSLLGIVISAVLALSSATFIGNGLAGIMLRMINNFKPGDFVSVNDHFGRITERGLFHTEMQTESSDLLTLPNMYLTTNPVRVTRSNGTFISAECSLGYDVPRSHIEKALLDAAARAELTDAFVRITSLGDYSVVYKVYGLVKEIKTILSSTSRLYGAMLDALHDANIEIVSPSFMNQRPIGDTVFIPKKIKVKAKKDTKNVDPESLIFDKAEVAEGLEKRKETLVSIEEKLKQFTEECGNCTDENEKTHLQNKVDKWTAIRDKLTAKIANERLDLNNDK